MVDVSQDGKFLEVILAMPTISFLKVTSIYIAWLKHVATEEYGHPDQATIRFRDDLPVTLTTSCAGSGC